MSAAAPPGQAVSSPQVDLNKRKAIRRAIAYNSSFSIFMGITPFVATLLVSTFDTIYAVWAYLAVGALLALVVVSAFMTETYRSHLGADKFAR
ncbi:hypothetical protein [Streptomyces sp. NPDC058632]|uniref:hypothetical protein n=1 Tax=unclassified Streptomyces TaxID=2593676 RepID=UPI003660578B